MRPELQHPTSNTTSAATGVDGLQQWNTPVPYLFGGVALMMGLIAVALLFLACSYKSSSSEYDEESSNEKSKRPMHDLRPEMEPRIVVIMAGETNPTHLAKPLAAAPATPRREEV